MDETVTIIILIGFVSLIILGLLTVINEYDLSSHNTIRSEIDDGVYFRNITYHNRTIECVGVYGTNGMSCEYD